MVILHKRQADILVANYQNLQFVSMIFLFICDIM